METALARLRAKTDQELCVLIARQLHRSRKLAARGAYRDAAKNYLAARLCWPSPTFPQRSAPGSNA